MRSKSGTINGIKRVLEDSIKIIDEEVNSFYKVSRMSNSEFLDKGLDDDTKQRIMLNALFSAKFDISEMRKEGIKEVEVMLKNFEMNKLKVRTIIDALSLSGMMKVTYRLPYLMVTNVSNEPFFLFLVVSGIRINGLFKNENDELMDNIEKDIYPLEKEMSQLIEEDFSIKPENVKAFMNLYMRYILLFVNLVRKEGIIKLDFLTDEIYDGIFDSMYYYAVNFKKLSDYYFEPKIVEGRHIKYSPLDTYISNGQIIKICDIDTFSSMLKDSDLSKLEKENYLSQMKSLVEIHQELANYIVNNKVVRSCDLVVFQNLLAKALLPEAKKLDYYNQMKNFLERIKAEELKSKIDELKKEYLSDDLLALYEIAKESGRVEATLIIKEIDSLFELLVEASLEDREELLSECTLYFDYLKEMFNKKDEKQPDSKVLYYKNEEDKVSILLEEIIKVQKVNYKQIFTDLKKIFNGNISNDKPLKGNPLNIPVYIKGKTFKIAYMVIDGITIIITGGLEEEINKNVLRILNSKEFLAYLKKTGAEIKSNNVADESNYTESILAELRKSEAVRRVS